MSLPTIYSSSPLCYLPLLDTDITLSTILSVSPQYTFLHPCVIYHFWPQISLWILLSVSPQYTVLQPCVTFPFLPHISNTAPLYQSPHNIQFFTPVLPSHFGPTYHSQHPIIRLPTIYSSSPLCYLPLFATVITLSTLLSVSPQYTVINPSVTFPLWPLISLSAPNYQSPHNILFFTPLLPSHFGSKFHSQHPIISLPTIYSFSTLYYLHFGTQISISAPCYRSPHNIQLFTPLLPSTFGPRYHSQHPIMSLPAIYSS